MPAGPTDVPDLAGVGWAVVVDLTYVGAPANIKQIMFLGRKGLQGAKKTAGQGVMSSHGKGLRSGPGAGEAV